MGMFREILACDKSKRQRKPIHGVGINDAAYITSPKINGKQVNCPFYLRWKSMLDRCYSKERELKYPSYKGCTVCDEWLTFSIFKSWMIEQEWESKELDKDILKKGNKEYSPDNCLFVSKHLNALLNDSHSSRGRYPQGVTFEPGRNKFKASCSVNGKMKNLGRYRSIIGAKNAYIKFKNRVIEEFSEAASEPLKSALLSHKIKIGG